MEYEIREQRQWLLYVTDKPGTYRVRIREEGAEPVRYKFCLEVNDLPPDALYYCDSLEEAKAQARALLAPFVS